MNATVRSPICPHLSAGTSSGTIKHDKKTVEFRQPIEDKRASGFGSGRKSSIQGRMLLTFLGTSYSKTRDGPLGSYSSIYNYFYIVKASYLFLLKTSDAKNIYKTLLKN